MANVKLNNIRTLHVNIQTYRLLSSYVNIRVVNINFIVFRDINISTISGLKIIKKVLLSHFNQEIYPIR